LSWDRRAADTEKCWSTIEIGAEEAVSEKDTMHRLEKGLGVGSERGGRKSEEEEEEERRG
jgi:hypothetical protein